MFIDGDNNQCGYNDFIGSSIFSGMGQQAPPFKCYRCTNGQSESRDASPVERVSLPGRRDGACSSGWTKNPETCKCYKCDKGTLKVRNRIKTALIKEPENCHAGWKNDPSKVGLNGDCGKKASPFHCYKCKADLTGEVSRRFKPWGKCKSTELRGASPLTCPTRCYRCRKGSLLSATQMVSGNCTSGYGTTKPDCSTTQELSDDTRGTNNNTGSNNTGNNNTGNNNTGNNNTGSNNTGNNNTGANDDTYTSKIVYGCMDSEALNYDPQANRDNKSCEYETATISTPTPTTTVVDDGDKNDMLMYGIIGAAVIGSAYLIYKE